MKVLSLKEPFATLISEQKKTIETRSWKTNYRGELYIHASKNYNTKLANLVDNLHCGKIICKCYLVDCIYMTKEYIESIKNENPEEYKYGIYKEGRYAWILKNITILKNPINANGRLGIWDYYDENEIMNLMKDIDYGWHDIDDNYMLQTPKEVINNKIGICWDQVELERFYFRCNDWNIETYFIVYYNNECPTHTFLTYEKNNKFYWFEHSWHIFEGIHEYNSKNDLLKDVKNKFIKHILNNKCNENKIYIYNYNKPKAHLNVQEFFKHCESGIVEKL